MSEKAEALKRLEQMQDPFVLAKDIAPVIGIKPETLIFQAKNPNGNPLPFHFVIIKTHVYFNRVSFIRFAKGGKK